MPPKTYKKVTKKPSNEDPARHQRKVTAYHTYIQPVLKALKQSHRDKVPYTLRYKVCNQGWKEKLNEVARQHNNAHNKSTIELQQITWDSIQNDFGTFIANLRHRLDQYALASSTIKPEDGLTKADIDYNTHMAQILDRLNREQPYTPYQNRFALAASLWQVRKTVRSEAFIEQEEEKQRQAHTRMEVQTVRGIRNIKQQIKRDTMSEG